MPEVLLTPPWWRSVATRWLAIGILLSFLATGLWTPSPAEGATALQRSISAARATQTGAERTMLQADRQVARLKASKTTAKKTFKRSRKMLTEVKKRRARAATIADRAREAYWEAYRARRRAEANDEPHTVSKKKVVRLRANMKRRRKSYNAIDRWVDRLKADKNAARRRIGVTKRSLAAARNRREGAEAVLRGTIAQMTALARGRVANKIGTEIDAGPLTFTWPAQGRISGGYGCTSAKFYPRRGSCAHFHDGIDIANAPGTPIHAMADGVVAFVGWNPSDIRGRAFIVVIAHRDGFLSRYGHMLPIRRVRAGDVVRKGERIAKMGSTGFSTGSHLHVELQAGSTVVNPGAYLPAREASSAVSGADISKPKERSADRKKTSKKAKRKARAKARRVRERRAARTDRRAAAASAAACEQHGAIAVAGDIPIEIVTGAPVIGDAATLGVKPEPETALLAGREGAADCESLDPKPPGRRVVDTSLRRDVIPPGVASATPADARDTGPVVRARATSPRPR